MKTLHLDCFSGISGNMFVGMLIQAGVPFEAFKKAMESLQLTGYELLCRSENKGGVQAIYYNVLLDAEKEGHGIHHEHHDHEHHDHDHHDYDHHDHDHHDHDHDHHDHEHHYERTSEHLVDTTGHHHHHQHRGLAEITQIIEGSPLADDIKTKSLSVFRALAEAEAKVHGVSVEEIHFHEVGAIDCILDIVGTVWCLKYLGIEQISASPLHAGSGFVRCAHGIMPVPAPATAELLAGIPWYSTDIKGELVTPTGAALVKVLAHAGQRPADFIYHTVAYGAGTKNLATPNVLRGFIGEASPL